VGDSPAQGTFGTHATSSTTTLVRNMAQVLSKWDGKLGRRHASAIKGTMAHAFAANVTAIERRSSGNARDLQEAEN
jgi:hypothetical protein